MTAFKISGKIINKKEREFLLSLGKRWCASCESVKEIDDFFSGQHSCKSCKKAKVDSWKAKNPLYAKEYRIKNKEKRRLYGLDWRRKNKEKYIKRRLEWRAEQRKNNVHYRVLNSLRCRLYEKIKNNKKSAHTVELLGCSVNELKIHLESQFKEGMSWANYGNPNGDHSNCWHIDHIVPCASFDLSDPEQQKKCFHFTNLQPLWADENMRKGAFNRAA